jgi:hypothetical protein
MPLKLSTTIGKIQNIPNAKNIEIVNEFLEYMKEVMVPLSIIRIIILRIFGNITSIPVCLENIETIVNQNKNRMKVIATNFFCKIVYWQE